MWFGERLRVERFVDQLQQLQNPEANLFQSGRTHLRCCANEGPKTAALCIGFLVSKIGAGIEFMVVLHS